MTKDVVHTPSNIKLLQVVELMVKHKISSVVITQAQENSGLNSKLIPIGIITEKDIVQFKTIELDLATIDAKRVMSTPLFSLSIEDSLLSVSFLMQQRKISHVVITNDQGELAGIITNSNMLKIMNPLEIYQLVNSLEKKINALESEKVELLAKRNLQLEQEVEKRTQELYNQTQQERLLADISDRIRASLNLEEILNISVKEVRKLLNCDRVLVEQYQLNHRGVIAAEAIIDHQIESLENKIEYSYFYHKFSSNSYPQQGIIIPNIYKYDYPNNYLKVLERYQIKSKLIVPIIVENNLWGLLIAHQCNSYREWEKLNLETMERLGVQLAIAIQQANAYETSQIQLQERQKAEIALQENEELFRNTFEQAAVGMIHIDLDRRFLRVNQCFCDIVGYSMAELLTLTVPEITHPEDKIHGWDLREKLFTGEIQNFTREKRYIRTDGLTVWANVTVTLLRSPNGEPKYFIAIVEDITARKAAQASLKLLNQELEKRVEERTLDLQQSEKRFRTLFTLAPDCIYVVNFAGIIQQVNRAVLEKSGYTEAELIGRKLQSFLSIQSQQIYEQNFHNFLETGNDDKEIEFYFKNGEMRIMNSSATIIYNDEHQPDYILILHKDITSRKQSEKQLLEISQLQTAILDGIDYSIISTDRNGMIQTFNAAAQEMLGYTPAEVIGRYTTELIHDQEEITQHAITLSAELGTSIAPGFDVFIAKARQGIISESEWTYIRKDGSKFPVLLSVSALWDQQNNITGFIGLAKDITLQKQAEQEKQLLEQRLQFLLAYSPAVIYSCAATPNYGVTFIGDNVYTMLGYQPQEFLADEKFWVERIHPDDQSQIISDLGSLFELGYHTHEYRFLHQNGEYYWLRDDLRLVRDDLGNPIEIIGCLININDRKNIENDLQERNNELAIANNNLERATKLKDEFLANMSHE
ncbi:MAG: PAS domain S-box protein, partial [Sphaerospermopsis kisseleviana]